ncbi:uncharacterized protein LOC103524116 [Trichonephila clavipes]|nr:uncharacterized protein LOC103524116 [Trichonephila clavipes]
MAFRAISSTPGQNIVIFKDSQATIKTVSGYNLFPSKLEFECKQFINSFLCTGREVVFQWIPSHCGIHGNEQAHTSWPRRLRCCFHLAFRCIFKTPSDFSGTNFDIREFPLLQTWMLANLDLVCSMAKDVFSFLPYLGWRVWHVSESSLNLITCKPICFKIGLADSPLCPLCKSGPMTGNIYLIVPLHFMFSRKRTVEFFLLE